MYSDIRPRTAGKSVKKAFQVLECAISSMSRLCISKYEAKTDSVDILSILYDLCNDPRSLVLQARFLEREDPFERLKGRTYSPRWPAPTEVAI